MGGASSIRSPVTDSGQGGARCDEAAVCFREGGHPAAAGQRHAGRERHVSAAGGDGEAGGAQGPHRGEVPLLLLCVHAPAGRGQSPFTTLLFPGDLVPLHLSAL